MESQSTFINFLQESRDLFSPSFFKYRKTSLSTVAGKPYHLFFFLPGEAITWQGNSVTPSCENFNIKTEKLPF